MVNESKIYNEAMIFLNSYDYASARKRFEYLCKKNGDFCNQARIKLVKIDIKEGKYARVRNILNNSKIHSTEIKFYYGLLENIEYNFERSKKYYSECMKDPSFQYKALISLTKLYTQTADYDIARNMYETLCLNEKFYVQAMFGLVCLNFLEKRYDEANRLLKSIDESTLTPKLLAHYDIMYTYTLYFLGELKDYNFDNLENKYTISRLFNSSDEVLLNHIKMHKNQKEQFNDGCFLETIDLKDLLEIAREKIKTINANHFELSDMYRFKLDFPIGFKEDNLTYDLCVSTLIGTKDIITMYPVLLSDEFDMEKMSTSKKLMLKRNEGSS
ncbi:MAG: hypothetical protein NC181_01480 [Clostridium sp.]|nr:hypothetical protein [Clostridium sp.]MCM1444490.1 hypothetical protein [Candidatus Amulumruptor caecigallinarius]